jgi:hypothetical protein
MTLMGLCACGDSSAAQDPQRNDASVEADGAVPSDAGGAPDSATWAPDVEVGGFLIELVGPAGDKPGLTSLSGKVADGPELERIVWELRAEEGGCQLFEPRVPFCEVSCGSEVCVEDDTCAPEPAVVDAGTLRLFGLRDAQGEPVEVTAKPILGGYSTPAGLSLAYPPFAEGDPLRVEAGGSLPAFSIEAAGIAPLALTEESGAVLEQGKGLVLAWTPMGQAGSSRIAVELDVSHHGGRKGKVGCDLDDDGAHTIAATLVDRLVALGVAGFPAVTLTRISAGSTRTPVGRIALEVRSSAKRELEIPGLVSCSGPEQCPEGQTCRSDLTCG